MPAYQNECNVSAARNGSESVRYTKISVTGRPFEIGNRRLHSE